MKIVIYSCFLMILSVYAQKVDYAAEIRQYAAATQKQIDDMFAGWANTVSGWQQDITLLSQADQTNYANIINKFQQTMDKAHADVTDQITQQSSKIQQKVAAEAPNAARSDAASFQSWLLTLYNLPAVSTVRNQFNTLQSEINGKVQPIKAQQSAEQAQKKQATQKAYEQKIQELLTRLNPINGAFMQAQSAANKFSIAYQQTGAFNQTLMNDAIKKYQDLIVSAAKVYNDLGFTIDIKDRGNLAVAALNRLVDLLLEDISLTIIQATKALKKKQPDTKSYYQILDQLAVRLEDQKKGYDQVIKQAASNFGDKATQIITAYHEKDSRLTVDAFAAAIQKLAVEVAKPTKSNIDYAMAYYKAITATDLSFLDAAKQSLIVPILNFNMASLYQKYAFTLFDELALAKDKNRIRTDALTAFDNAYKFAQIYEQVTTQNVGFASTFKIRADKFRQAIQQFNQAQTVKNSNINQAIDLYEQASTNFSAVGDTFDANNSLQIHYQLKGDQAIAGATKQLNDFVTANRTQLQEYVSLISGIQQAPMQIPLSVFEPLLQSMTQTAQEAIPSFTIAINAYEQGKIATNKIESAVTVLQNFVIGNQLRGDADAAARSASSTGLTRAQSLYQEMLNAYAKSDAAFADTAPNLVPFYPSLLNLGFLLPGQKWTFNLIGQRHAAKQYIEIAASLTNQFIAYQYFSQANSFPTISIDVRAYLAKILQTLQIQKDQVDKLLAEIGTKETAALGLGASAWQPDPSAVIYSSQATLLWKEIISAYRSAALLKYADAFARYTNALIEYADAYKNNVPTNYFPAIGAAMIRYELMLAYETVNDSENSANSMIAVQKTMQEFFAQAQELMKQIDDTSQILTATIKQEQLVRWQTAANQALNEQQQLINTLLPQNSTVPLKLQQEIDTAGNYIYSLVLADGTKALSITIASPDAKFAQLFEKVGDAYVDKTDYVSAVQNYAQAKNYLQKIGSAITAITAKIQRATAYKYVMGWLRSAVPNDKDTHDIPVITVATTQVPEHFETYYVKIVIPPDIPVELPLEFSTWLANPEQYKDQLKATLIRYAYLTFAFQIAQSRGFAFNTIFSGGQPVANLDTERNLVLVDAKRITDLLSTRFDQKRSSIILFKDKDKNGNEIYVIGIYYLPIPVKPMTDFFQAMPLYTKYPSIFTYQNVPGFYDWVLAFAGTNDQIPSWAIPTAQYLQLIGLNDAKILAQIKQAAPRAYLAGSEQFKKRADYLISGKDIDTATNIVNGTAKIFALDPLMTAKEALLLTSAKNDIENKLKKANKIDFSVKLSDYLWILELLKSYITYPISAGIVLQYANLAKDFYPDAQDAGKLAAVNQYIASLYEWMGDAGQLFLVGDPQSADYFFHAQEQQGGVLDDVRQYYLRAISLYNDDNKAAVLYQKTGDLFDAAADLVTTKLIAPADDPLIQAKVIDQKRNYFGAVNMYLFGYAAYKAGKNIDQKIKDRAVLAWINAIMNGSAQNLVAQANVRKMQVTITLQDSGLSVQRSYDELIQNALGDPAETQLRNALKSDILDVLAYLNNLNISIPFIIGDTVPDAIKTAALDKINKYMKDNNISVTSIKDITDWMVRSDFKQTLLAPIDQFGKAILATTDGQTRTTNFSAIQQWVSTIYAAFKALYGNDFWPAKTVIERASIIESEINNEMSNIYAPSEQWLGKFGGQ